jgi:hypothetical protein
MDYSQNRTASRSSSQPVSINLASPTVPVAAPMNPNQATAPSASNPIVSVNQDLNKRWNDMNAYIIPDPRTLQDDPQKIFTNLVTAPKKIKIPLMEHQKYAVNYCLSMESTTSFVPPGTDHTILTNKALFCDPVGAGKSLVMLSLISEKPVVHTKSQVGASFANGITVFQKQQGKEIIPVSLIVVPNTLFTQWKDYVQTQTTLKFAYLGKKSDFTKCDFTQIDGVLVNSNFYNDIADLFDKLTFSRVIFDEVHMMKIPNSKIINASFYWFISASPSEIDRFTGKKHGFLPNSLRSILSVTSKCGIIFRNEQRIIDMSIHLPKANTRILKVRTSNILNVLNGIVSNGVLEAIAAGDSKSAIDQLSLERTDEDNIINVVNKHLQQELESHEQELEAKKIRVYSSKKAKDDALKLVEDKITEVKKKIKDIKDRIFNDNIDPITYDEITTPVISKCCQNKFEFSSLTEYLLKSKQACPMCRKPMNPKDLVLLNEKKDAVVDSAPSQKDSKDDLYENKEKAMEHLLAKLGNKAKIVVSSGPTGNFMELLKVANKYKLTVRQFNGNIQTKNKILDDFHKGHLNILYLPAYESGSGLNLVEVTDMVLYHKMPNGIEDQVIGRCQRLGRTFPLNIWKVYFENEL